MKKIRAVYSSHPIFVILLVAFVLRLVAVFFSQGYAMHDDHFLIIESSSSWSHGHDYNKWLPATQQDWVDQGLKDEVRPEGHSLVYPGVHYLLFETFNFFGLENPKAQMYVVRFLHALFGVWLVWLVFSFAQRITSDYNARMIAWVAAIGWAMAFLSVRNLVEIVCIPFMFLALIQIHKGISKHAVKFGVLAGLYIAIAIAIRYQLFVFFGVLGIIMLLHKRWLLSLSMLLGFALFFGLLQGLLDYLIWGYPFAEMIEYFSYNSGDARFDYAEGNASFYGLNYWMVLAFVTVPLLGAFWFFGYFTQWKKHFWLFAPSFAFLTVHMAYVNLQERFIFPIMHLVLILGVVGWNEYKSLSRFWLNNKRLWNGIVTIAVVLNFMLLIFTTTYYGKKARVEASYYITNSNLNIKSVFQENTSDEYIPMIPLHYAGGWDIEFTPIKSENDWKENVDIIGFPKLIFFHGARDLDERIQVAENYLGRITEVASFQPSWQDRFIQWLNPMNRNDAIFVYVAYGE
jgi:hypothetical protein